MQQTPETSMCRWKWAAAILPIVLCIAWLGYRWIYPAYEPPSQPSPNAYPKLVELSDQLARRTITYSELPDEELANIVNANEPTLQAARKAIRLESSVALDWQADKRWLETHLEQIGRLRNLSRGFAAEGLYAVRQGDVRRGIDCGLENMRLGEAISRGGLGTDWLTGIAVRTVGLMTLRDACEAANLDDCRYVSLHLSDATDQIEPPADITRREWHFFRRINGVWSTFLAEMTFANNRADFENRMTNSLVLFQTRTDLLRLHYAIRRFNVEKERLPVSLSEIYRFAGEPANHQDFVYQAAGDRYLLYAVGLNGIDDGGTTNDLDPTQGDIRLEPGELLAPGAAQKD